MAKKKANQVSSSRAQQQIQVQQTTAFQGPIPAPDTLAQYDQLTPGLADRIVSMAEREAAHRHNQESKILQTDARLALKASNEILIGQCFGLVMGLATIGAGTYLALSGESLAGGLIGSSGIIGLVSIFVLGRSSVNTDK